MDGFAAIEIDPAACQRHALRREAFQVHFDAPDFSIVKGMMRKADTSKSAPSSRLIRRSRLRLNSAVMPWASLYAARRTAGSFLRSTPTSIAPPDPASAQTLRRNCPASEA